MSCHEAKERPPCSCDSCAFRVLFVCFSCAFRVLFGNDVPETHPKTTRTPRTTESMSIWGERDTMATTRGVLPSRGAVATCLALTSLPLKVPGSIPPTRTLPARFPSGVRDLGTWGRGRGRSKKGVESLVCVINIMNLIIFFGLA